MKILVDTYDAPIARGWQDEFRRHVSQALDDLAPEVFKLCLRFRDRQETTRQNSTICVIRAELSDGGQILVASLGDNFSHALGRCLPRVRIAIEREVGRDPEPPLPSRSFRNYAFSEPVLHQQHAPLETQRVGAAFTS